MPGLCGEGYVRARIDHEIRILEEVEQLEKNKKHDIDVVVDRIVKSDDRSRLHDSLESALKLSDGLAVVAYGEEEILFSSNYACKYCGFSIPKLEPKLFSFNAPFGACPTCKGLGFTQKVDIDYLIPDRSEEHPCRAALFFIKISLIPKIWNGSVSRHCLIIIISSVDTAAERAQTSVKWILFCMDRMSRSLIRFIPEAAM